jgi:heme exporter protein B
MSAQARVEDAAETGVAREGATVLATIRAVAWKDLIVERRSKANFNSVVFLAGVILLLFGFALGPDTAALRDAAAGVIWLTVLFSGVLSFNRSYEQELEDSALEALLLYPVDRRGVYLGKLVANVAFLLALEAVLLFAAAILYGLPLLEVLPELCVVLFLGTLGFAALGTFYGAMTSRLRAREFLMPLLLFPMLVPLLVAAVGATGALLAGDPFGNAGAWMRALVAFDIIFVAAATLAFDYVIEE